MTKKQQLQKVYDDYTSHLCREIQLVWIDGTRAGIGNPKIIALVIKTLIDELKRQINETEDS